jgi:hypothetical protein
MEEWRYSFTILDLGSRWMLEVSFTPEKGAPLRRSPGGQQNKSGHSDEENLAMPGIESRLSIPIPSLIY